MRKAIISLSILFIVFLITLAIRLSIDFNKDKAIDKDAIAYAVDIAIDANNKVSVHDTVTSIEEPIIWEEIAEGIEFTFRNEALTVDIPNANKSTNTFNVYLVKIDPEKTNFTLQGAFLEQDKKSYSMQDWCKNNNLTIAINASMYLPDKQTSTGHMRANSSINNAHIAQNMGGFFLTHANAPTKSKTILLEKSSPNWEESLTLYDTAVQNFRILGSNSDDKSIKTLWHYTNNKHAIAAYGQDIQGNIYFIFSQNPTTVYELGQYLLALSNVGLDFNTVLYAEGGREASLYINTEKKKLYITGLNNFIFNLSTPLPNIIGVKSQY